MKPYLHVAVDKPVQFNVIIILAEGIDKNFSHFQPSDVEAELKQNQEPQMTYH
jgi:hypothetical protein